MATKTCTVTKKGDRRWLVRCTRCSYREIVGNWTVAARKGWRHRCG